MSEFKGVVTGGLETRVSMTISAGTIEAWTSATFAPDWYGDAQEEATREGRGARRREVIFAVAAAECYLLEWVRDDVLHHDYRALEQYFPPDGNKRVLDKWRDIPKQLHAEGRIDGMPDLSRSSWSNFRSLVNFRNGLMHGRASRPGRVSPPDESQPMPSLQELDGLSPGWAAQAVRTLIAELNDAAGTVAPPWLGRRPA